MVAKRKRSKLGGTLCITPLVLVGTLGAAGGTANAHPNVERRGGQWEVVVGGTGCIPGRAACRTAGGVDVAAGSTRPSFGTGGAVGWRATRWLFIGAAYRFGLFNPQYELAGVDPYTSAYQHGVFGVLRPILPIWRVDLGLDLAPGWTRQVFRYEGGDKDYSQGFAFMIGPTVDFWVARRIFLGAKADFIFNAHRRTCEQRGGRTTCLRSEDRHLAPVHMVIFGFHLGGTFG